MGTKNLVLLPASTGFFAPLGDSIVRHYKRIGEEAILVTSTTRDFSLEPLKKSSLLENVDWIQMSHVSEYLQYESNDSTGCNLVLWLFDEQGYRGSVEEIVNLIADKISGPLSFSIYPDGWLNKFWKDHTYFQIISLIEGRGMKPADRFHFACIHPHSVSDLFNDIVLEDIAISLSRTYDSADYLPATREIVETLASKASLADAVIIVALRPWGSATFHGGKYAFNSQDANLGTIILETLGALCENFNLESPLIVLRRDNRDIDYMDSVVHAIVSTTSMPVVDISQQLPHWLPLDCLFYCLKNSKAYQKPLYIVAQDSSTPIAPIVLGMAHTALYGLPSQCKKAFQASSIEYIQSNLEMHRALVEALAHSKSANLDEMLFAINIS